MMLTIQNLISKKYEKSPTFAIYVTGNTKFLFTIYYYVIPVHHKS